MVAIRADADRFLAAPPEDVRVFLIYGSDAGAVTERARLVERVALQRGGGDTVLRLGSDRLSDEPGLVADETRAGSLFGGEPVVSLRVLDGRHNVVAAVQDLLDRPPDAAWLIVEAGELQASNLLRKAFEKAPHAAAVQTFATEGVDLGTMVKSAAAEAGIVVDTAAHELLVHVLGGDRLASRGELEKLFLYVGDSGSVTVEDVEAVVGDTAEARTDQLIDAALLGDHEALETELERLRAEGGAAGSLGSQALRHLFTLSGLRTSIEAGSSTASALERARPPIFARRRNVVEAQLRRWTSGDLATARARVADAVELTRRQPALDEAAMSQVLHELALQARRLRAAGRG